MTDATISEPFVFFGTSKFAVYILEELKRAEILPLLIVTTPDRKAGRGLILTPPPVKIWAEQNSINIAQPEKLNRVFLETLSVANCTFAVVASYGQIIPQSAIAVFPKSILNVHPSLLPKYRGPSPIQSQILSDEPNIGVSIMLLDNEVDHGPILATIESNIRDKMWPLTYADLEESLAREGGKLLTNTLPGWVANKITPTVQNHALATDTKKITKADGLIDETDILEKPYDTYLKICALNPWPAVYFFRNGQRIKIKSAAFDNGVLTNIKVVQEGGKEILYSSLK